MVKEALRDLESFCRRVPSYDEVFKDGLREGSANLLERVENATNDMVIICLLGPAKIVDVKFNFANEMLQTVETEVSHL